MSNPIGKLQRVPLREVWRHEAYDFTQWLLENVDILNESLGLDLVSAEREQAAGSFSIDLVAESSDGETYVIENQLERSNHDHLGKVITVGVPRNGVIPPAPPPWRSRGGPRTSGDRHHG